ncbi:hypothetical protein GCM10022246_15380 [Pedobacter ginsengiterrae]|uniref:KAP NTPase domain-containing protein n=1 Tax=Pedobacter ginsengiterrae TaxID=871696 RepID=A0ABP7PBU6_9SPHI
MKLKEPLVYKNLESKFENCLEDPSNSQILFSGPFGSGKTTFLKTYFETRNQYNVFRIFPVNYVLHDNSDIFEILKYDIILELINKKAFSEPDIDKLTKYVYSISQSIDQALGKMINLFSDTGKSVVEVAEVMEKSLVKNQSDYAALSNPLLSVQTFLNTIKKYKKYAYNDYITSVIQEKLLLLTKEGKTKNVLIVDDMDRIDPDHLFRIISIFSSHIDIDTQTNKFGFDKIIFVGDNENFRSMFFHRYGILNNYNAYISKLCSKSPFNFDPDRELYTQILEIVSGIKFRYLDSAKEFHIYENKSASVARYYNYILCAMIKSGALSLRELIKYQGVHPLLIRNDEHVAAFNDFIDQFSIFNLAMLLNQIIPAGLSHALQGLLENTLNADKIVKNGGIDKGALNSDLSIIPLEFYLVEESNDEANNGATKSINISGEKFSVTFSRIDRQDRLAMKIPKENANERQIIVLTMEAIKKMQPYLL